MRSFVFFLSFMVSTAFGAKVPRSECPDKNLKSRFGANRGNGGVGWCWANVTADLVGYAQGVRPPERISSQDVAVAQLDVSSFDIENVFQRLGDRASHIPQEFVIGGIRKSREQMNTQFISTYSNDVSLSLISYQSKAGYCLESEAGIDVSNEDRATEEFLESAARVVKRSLGQPLESISDCDPFPSNSTEAFQLELNQKLIAQMKSRLDADCGERHPMTPMVPKVTATSKSAPATAQLTEALRNEQPLAVGFLFDFLSPGIAEDPQSTMHVATVVASKWQNGRCEFLLRDGNGTGCGVYAEKFQSRCEGGNIWLSDEEVDAMTLQTYGIEQPALSKGDRTK